MLDVNKILEQLNLLLDYNCDVLATCKWYRKYDYNDNQLVLMNLNIYKNYSNPITLLEDYGRYSCFFPPHCFLVPRKTINDSSSWNENLKINQDGLFYAHIILNVDKIVFTPNTSVYYRMHDNEQTSLVNSKKKAIDLTESWRLIGNLFRKNSKKKLVKQYLKLGKDYSYSLIKEAGYKEVIFLNVFFFRDQLMRDIWKKMRILLRA